ncbi:MAG: hypothetical protein WCN99_00385 [bacterium]|nr:hypothetical protein [Coprothermobacterota bacterium]
MTKESLFELEAYCGLLWSEAKTMLDAEGAIIAEEVLLTPPYPVEPVGEQRLLLLKQTSSGWVAYLTHENYLSPGRQPRSMDAFLAIQGRERK